MGLIDKLFRKKEKEESSLEKVDGKNNVPENNLNIPPVHPDIVNLIWIVDGQNANYIPTKKQEHYEYNGIKIIIPSITNEEPSLISLIQPVSFVDDISKIERPPYYPRYLELTPEQKGVYWKLLENPYNPNIDIGFVFILYYGLERHLLSGNYEEAFNVILKLRDVHKNQSFQRYSANALILTSLCRQRADLTIKFLKSIDHDYELKFSDNLYLLCILGLDIPVSPKDIMRMAKTFGFENNNYIKKYPEIFEKNLLEKIRERYGAELIYLKDIIDDTGEKIFNQETIFIFANMSISDKEIKVPIISSNKGLKNAMKTLLEETHETTKIELVALRKSGEIKPEIKKEKSPKELPIFDSDVEKGLLESLKEAENDTQKRHFMLQSLGEYYYKYRELDDKYIDESIKYCLEDIKNLEKLQSYMYSLEVEQIKRHVNLFNKENKTIEELVAEIKPFIGKILSFKRLVLIYERDKKYLDAIDICNQAINYYTKYGMEEYADEFKERKEKLSKKLEK